MRILVLFLLIQSFLCARAIEKEEAFDFLFSTLSLPDKTDYPEQFYIDNIEASFKAREEMPWGKQVPEREFLHFVIPVRVNNENLDSSRMVFYEELKDRVKDLSMEEAILEVNHWCHEHVTYQPSDARTSSPLSSVSQAIGRCGEESTLTVAALRSVGIPARQIYTPRWAHTDDNHAWVEAWANGKWYFLGACEPEAVLNVAWFNEPASRGLLMTTNVVGEYQGEEEILFTEPLTTRINVTENYAPIGQLEVEIEYPDGSPVKDAKVNFCIYNYAEFYPAVSKLTDENGRASLNAGLGDMLVWATDGGSFGFAKGRPQKGKGETLKIILDKNKNTTEEFVFDIVPPKSSVTSTIVSEDLKEINASRLAYEDSLRNAYVASFANAALITDLAQELNLDEKRLSKVLNESRGNHDKISNLLSRIKPSERDTVLMLLEVISEKDRRDIDMETVIDHISNVVPFSTLASMGMAEQNLYSNYILNPRIENEFIRPWRGVLTDGFGTDTLTLFRNDVNSLISWVNANIEKDEQENPQKLRMSPIAVWKSRKADDLSRNIFFVASARTAGVPARINSVNGDVEYFSGNGKWEKVSFEEINQPIENREEKGYLNLTYMPGKRSSEPKYYSQFTLSKIENGEPHLLEYDENSTFSEIFLNPIELENGQYILTSGQRLADGSVLSRSEIFTVNPGDTTNIPLIIREDENRLSVIGSLNAENIYHDIRTDTDKSILSTTGRGYYVLGIISPNHEPSEHALNDISAVKDAIEDKGRTFLLLFEDEAQSVRFDASRFPDLPQNVVFGIDNNQTSKNEIIESLNLVSPFNPIFVVADSFNRIVWISSGYTIGMGEKLVEVLSSLE